MRRAVVVILTATGIAALAFQLAVSSATAQGRGPSVRAGAASPKGKPATPGAQGRAVASTAKSKSAPPKSTTKQTEIANQTGHQPAPADLLTRNTRLRARLQLLLPGTNLDTAIVGFRNFGLFVATAHVSHNLGIPFDALRMKLINEQKSLGQAIQDLKPNANADAEVKKAQETAEQEIAANETPNLKKKKNKEK